MVNRATVGLAQGVTVAPGQAKNLITGKLTARDKRRSDRLLAEGTIRLGWVDSTTLKPGRIPAAVLEALK